MPCASPWHQRFRSLEPSTASAAGNSLTFFRAAIWRVYGHHKQQMFGSYDCYRPSKSWIPRNQENPQWLQQNLGYQKPRYQDKVQNLGYQEKSRNHLHLELASGFPLISPGSNGLWHHQRSTTAKAGTFLVKNSRYRWAFETAPQKEIVRLGCRGKPMVFTKGC